MDYSTHPHMIGGNREVSVKQHLNPSQLHHTAGAEMGGDGAFYNSYNTSAHVPVAQDTGPAQCTKVYCV